MEYISSPAAWFLRDKTAIVGLTKIGIKAIAQQGLTAISLPSEKDGFVFTEIHESFYQSLADFAPQIETVCTPPSIKVKIYDRIVGGEPYPLVCSFKRLIVNCAMQFRSAYVRLCFNDNLEAIELPDDPMYSTKDGVVYTKDYSGIIFYPRSKTNPEFVLPETVTFIGTYAFQNTKYVNRLTCPKELTRIADYAFDNSSITEFITFDGTIKDNLASKEAFTNCKFTIPPIISAYTPEEASRLTLEALRSDRLDDWPNEAFKYLTSVSDDIIDALLNRLKNEHNRRVTIDAGIFLPLIDRQPMTRKLFELYDFLADYNNFDNTLPTKHPITVRESVEQFKLYRLTGYRGEVKRKDAFDVGCYITGHMPSKLPGTEEEVKTWLKARILDAVQAGKKLFITKTSSGVCCLAAETVIDLFQQYPEIKLLLIWGSEYEYENVGFGHYNRLAGGIVYDKKPTEKSMEWKPRLEAIKEQANMLLYTKGDVASWIPDHCTRIITTWHTNELAQRLVERANEKGIEIVAYQEQTNNT